MVIKKKKVKPEEVMSFTIEAPSDPKPKKLVKKKKKVSDTPSDRPVPKKKKVVVKSREEAPVKKVKSRPSMDLVPLSTRGPKRISKLDRKGLVSIIADDADKMQELFEEEDTEAAIRLLNRRLIQTCIDLIPQLENSMRESNGRYGAHALNGTIQTIRELMVDLQRMQDRGAIGEAIVERIIRPALLEMATKVVEEAATVLSEVKDLMPHETYSKFRQAQIQSRDRLASVMTERYNFMRDETVKFLQG
jgi:hypothetical protein